MSEESKKRRGFFSLIRRLSACQAAKAKNELATHAKTAKYSVEIACAETEQRLKEAERKYSAGKKQSKEILTEYRKAYEDVANKYRERKDQKCEEQLREEGNLNVSMTLMRGAEKKYKDQCAVVNSLKNKEGNKIELDKAEKERDRLAERCANRRNEVKAIYKKIEKIKNEYKEILDKEDKEIGEKRDKANNQLVEVKKQGFFGRHIGSLLNKINGTKKFMEEAYKPVKKEIDKLKEDLKKFPGEVKKGTGMAIEAGIDDAKEVALAAGKGAVGAGKVVAGVTVGAGMAVADVAAGVGTAVVSTGKKAVDDVKHEYNKIINKLEEIAEAQEKTLEEKEETNEEKLKSREEKLKYLKSRKGSSFGDKDEEHDDGYFFDEDDEEPDK